MTFAPSRGTIFATPMAIGIVSDIEFENELLKNGSIKRDRTDTIPKVEIIDKPSRGRSENDVNVPDSLRKVIGETAVIDGRGEGVRLAESFGISPSSVSAYAKGATSTTSYNTPSPSIKDHITKSRQRAVKRASKTLNAALGAITQEKLDYTDAKDLSGIAKDMSVIIRNLEPPAENVDTNSGKVQPQFVIFAPQFRKEETFKTITVNE